MERQRREFLRTMSTPAVLPALAPILKAAAETGSAEDPPAFSAAASRDFRAHFPILKESTCTTMRIQQNLFTRWPAVLPRRTTPRE
jgi:hypothetical protein